MSFEEPMASTCSLCIQDGKTSDPTEWCPQCSQLLCQACAKTHKRINSTKDHEVIPYDDYSKLPSFIVNTKSFCSEHGKKLSNFCRIHDTLTCAIDRDVYHKTCDDVPTIEDIVHNVKDSVLFENIFIELETLCRKLKDISDDRKKNLHYLKNNRQEIEKSFEQKLGNNIDNLKKLKEKTISEINTVYIELTNDLSNTYKIIESTEKKLREILDQKDDIRRFASNYQTFIGLKEIEKMVQDTYTDLNELSEKGKFNQCTMEFEMNETIEDIVHGTQSLGEVQVIKSPSDVSIHITRPSDLEAQKEVQIQIPKKIYFKQTIALDKSHNFSGCCILSSGLIIFAKFGNFLYLNNKSNIYVYNSNFSLKSIIKFKDGEGLRDVTPVDDHHVAVSHPWSATISIVDVLNNKVVRTLKTGESVRGLCCRGKEIVCCVDGKGLARVNMDSEGVETVVIDMSVDVDSHVQVSDKLVCYTCPYRNTVTVLDTHYNPVFTYKDEAVLGEPTGVTIDDHNNIYVTGYGSHNLVVISPDGKSYHQLLGNDDGLDGPTAVHYDSRTRKLVVVNWQGPAFVYSLENDES